MSLLRGHPLTAGSALEQRPWSLQTWDALESLRQSPCCRLCSRQTWVPPADPLGLQTPTPVLRPVLPRTLPCHPWCLLTWRVCADRCKQAESCAQRWG